jgi:ABC-type spermidine/putrescine transport system permease subunit I
VSGGRASALAEGLSRRAAQRRAWHPELQPLTALVLAAPMVVAFSLFVFYPAYELLTQSFSNGWANFGNLFKGAERRALQTTLSDSLLVTVITLILGGVVAWTLRTTRSRVVTVVFWTAVVVPMSMSVVVKNYAWITILGRFGALNWVIDSVGLPRHSFLFTTTAVTIGMVYSLFPFAVFPLYLTFRSIPDELLDAAESLGGRWWQTMTTVVLPLSVSGFFITGVLLFVFSIGFFVTPVVLGGPRSTFLAAMINQDIALRFDQPAAAAKAVFLIAAALVLVALALRLVGHKRFERAIG